RAVDAGDQRRGLLPLGADLDRVVIAPHAGVVDVDVVAAGGEVCAGVAAERRVVVAGGVGAQRACTERRVAGADGVGGQRALADRRVAVGGGVGGQCVAA